MENWLRGLSKQNAIIFGALFAILAFAGWFAIGGAIGGGIMGGALAMAFMIFHKAFTGLTLKEKQEQKNNQG